MGTGPRRRFALSSLLLSLMLLLVVVALLGSLPSVHAGKERDVAIGDGGGNGGGPPLPEPAAEGGDDEDDEEEEDDEEDEGEEDGNGEGGASVVATSSSEPGNLRGTSTSTTTPEEAGPTVDDEKDGDGEQHQQPATEEDAAAVAALDLPEMEFQIGLSATASPASVAILDKDFVGRQVDAFLESFVSSNAALSGVGSGGGGSSFRGVDLDTKVIDLSDTAGLVVAKTSGEILYSTSSSSSSGSEHPTQDDVRRTVMTYFSFWGAEDMFRHLMASGMPITKVVVRVDGEVVSQSALPPSEFKGTGAVAAAGEGRQSPPSSSSSNQQGIVIAICVVAAAVMLLALGLCWYCRLTHRGSRTTFSPAAQKNVLSLDTSDDMGGGGEATPRTGKTASTPGGGGGGGADDHQQQQRKKKRGGRFAMLGRNRRSGSEANSRGSGSSGKGGSDGADHHQDHRDGNYDNNNDEQQSYCGVASLAEDSIFTSDNRSCLFHYDASRLDHVISSARGFPHHEPEKERRSP